MTANQKPNPANTKACVKLAQMSIFTDMEIAEVNSGSFPCSKKSMSRIVGSQKCEVSDSCALKSVLSLYKELLQEKVFLCALSETIRILQSVSYQSLSEDFLTMQSMPLFMSRLIFRGLDWAV